MQNELFYIIFLAAMLAMFFGYNMKLDQRTLKLEKKNGHEQHQIDELKAKIAELEKENEELRQELQELKTLLHKYQRKHKQIE